MDSAQLGKITQQRNEDLAKSLGYRSFKEMKGSLSKGNLSGGINSRLEQGGGIAESIGGGIKSNMQGIKASLNPKSFGKKVYNELFDGDDMLSAYMRGLIVKKPGKPKESKESKPAFTETLGKKLVGRDKKTGQFTKLTDEEQLEKQRKLGLTKITPTAAGGEGEGTGGFGSNIAGDVATIRQSISALLGFEKEKKEQSDSKSGADYFKEQDAREAALEASPSQITVEGGAASGGEEEKSGGGGLGIIGKLVGFLKKGLLKAFKFLFKPSRLLKVLGKVFILATIFISLFKGITAGFDRYKETGNIGEAITAGLGAMLEFLTFGIFGEDTLKTLFKKVGDFTKPIIDKIGGVFTGIMDWVKNNVGVPYIELFTNKFTGKPFSIGPYYPFKDDPSNPNDVNSAAAADGKIDPIVSEKKANEIINPEPAKDNSIAAIMKRSKEATPESRMMFKIKTRRGLGLPLTSKMKEFEATQAAEESSNSPTGKLKETLGGSEMQSVISQLPQSDALNNDVAGVQNFIQDGGIDSAMSKLSEGTAGVKGSMDNAVNTLTNKINAVSPTTTSGAVVSSGSVEVDSGQRQERMGSGGSVVNAPTTTNNTGTTGNDGQQVAPVINFEFAESLMRT